MNDRYEAPLEQVRGGAKANACKTCFWLLFVVSYVGSLIGLAIWVLT